MTCARHPDENINHSDNTRAGRWDFASPYVMRFRVVRFKLKSGIYETLATSLPREVFSLDDLRELFHARWGIETAFRELKYGVGLVNLHGKSMEFAMQEIYASMILSNFCARIAGQAVMETRERRSPL
ncbi:MAG: transposase [Clostridia bacterium]|nr:transposase [Clostridia bacterium]